MAIKLLPHDKAVYVPPAHRIRHAVLYAESHGMDAMDTTILEQSTEEFSTRRC